jgi:Zn finger protein HypA/HybF involved in hydrogenase expression
MKLLQAEQLEFNMIETKINKLIKCNNCGKLEKVLYQKNFCRTCLSSEFKLYIKIIDSVRR